MVAYSVGVKGGTLTLSFKNQILQINIWVSNQWPIWRHISYILSCYLISIRSWEPFVLLSNNSIRTVDHNHNYSSLALSYGKENQKYCINTIFLRGKLSFISKLYRSAIFSFKSVHNRTIYHMITHMTRIIISFLFPLNPPPALSGIICPLSLSSSNNFFASSFHRIAIHLSVYIYIAKQSKYS